MEDFLEELKNDHSEFDLGKLEVVYGKNPFDLFNQWMKNAIEQKCIEPNAITISTVDSTGQPSSRVAYLKELKDQKFIFYTNYHSQKGRNLAVNNKICILFFWPEIQQQVRIEGTTEKVDDVTNDAYFHSRPRGSQIGAWASQQSEELLSREELENRFHEFAINYPNEVPRPPHWGGYEITATKIEFWQGRPSRLHDRIVFIKENNNWKIVRLNP